MSDTPTLTLVYFNARGLAETSRILLALAQVDYIDKRYPIEIIDPVKHIYNRDEFDHDKKAGVFDKSMGKLPILRINDEYSGNIIEIPQSKAIERYISKHYGFMGNDLLEEARIDSVCECIRDIKDRYQKSKVESETNCDSNLKTEFLNLVKVLDQGTRCAVGNKLSLADVSIYCLVTQFLNNKEATNIAASIDRIRDIVVIVASRPEVRIWLSDRPKTDF
jgi:glutathione S-transferase